MMLWLLNEATLRELRHARDTLRPTAANERVYLERIQAAEAARTSDRGPKNLALAGDVAEIRVEGILVQQPSFLLWLLGYDQTTYSDIQQAIAIAQADPSVSAVRFYVDSPGGTVDGLFDTLAAIESLRGGSKKTSVRAANAFSAAYGIAAAAGPIEATNVASSFGSVGVAASYLLDETVVDLTNTDSPDKRPDVSTDEGRAVVVKYLDALFELFVEAIAKGRGTTSDKVVKNFGRGASFVASEALSRGMIDTIAKPSLRVVPGPNNENAPESSGGTETTMATTMTLKELRAQHPDLIEEAVQEGVTQERDRVCAHLTMGEASGDMKTAIEAIQSGAGMTQAVTAKYLAAGMNRADRSARQTETDEAGKVVDGSKTATETKTADLGDQVVALIKQQGGL